MNDISLLQFLTRGGLQAIGDPPTEPAENQRTSVSTLEKVEGMIASIEGNSPLSHNGTHSGLNSVGDATDHHLHNPLTVFSPSRVLAHPLQSTRSAFTSVSRRAPSSPIVVFQTTTVERPPPSETPAPSGFEDRHIKKEELSPPGETRGPYYQFPPPGKEIRQLNQPSFPALVMATQGHHFPPPSSQTQSNHAKYKKSRRDSQAHLLRLPPSHSAPDTMSLSRGDSLDDQAHPPILTSPTVKDSPNMRQDCGSSPDTSEGQSLISPSPSTSNPPPRLDGPYSREGDGPLKIKIMLNPHCYFNPPTSSSGRPPKNLLPPSPRALSPTTAVIGGVQQPQHSGSTTSDEIVSLEDVSVPSSNRRFPPPRHPGPPPFIGRYDPTSLFPPNYRPPSPSFLSKYPPHFIQLPSSTNNGPSTGVIGAAQQPQSSESATSEKAPSETNSVPLTDRRSPPPSHPGPPPQFHSLFPSNLPPTYSYLSNLHPPPFRSRPSSTNDSSSTGPAGDVQEPQSSESTTSAPETASVPLTDRPLPLSPPASNLPSTSSTGRHPQPIKKYPVNPPPPPPPRTATTTSTKPTSGIIGDDQQAVPSGSTRSEEVKIEDAPLPPGTLPGRHPSHSGFPLNPPPPGFYSTNNKPPTGKIGAAQDSEANGSTRPDTVPSDGAPPHPSALLGRPLPPPPGFLSTNNNPSSGVIGASPQSQPSGSTTSHKAPQEGTAVRPPSAFHQVSPSFNPRAPPFIHPQVSSNHLNTPWCLPQTMPPSFTNNNFCPGALGAGQPWGAPLPAPIHGDPIPVIPNPSVQGFKDAVARSNGLALLDPDQNLIIESEQGRKWAISSNFLLVALNEAVALNPEGVCDE